MTNLTNSEGANARQVGGDHYAAPVQHWDFVLAAQLDYLAGCATKYVVRHRKKKGAEDLEKAVHYVEKLIEAQSTPGVLPWSRDGYVPTGVAKEFLKWVREAVGPTEWYICYELVTWGRPAALVTVADTIRRLIEREYAAPGAEPPGRGYVDQS